MIDAAPPSAPSGGSPAPGGRSIGTSPAASGSGPPAAASTSSTSRGVAPVLPIGPLRAPGLPSTAALALARAPRRELEVAVVRGITPDLDALAGWEFRGINATPPGAPPIARLAGIEKFVKGMFLAGDGRVMGYNCPVVQNVLDGRWQTRPSDADPKRFGFYTIVPVDPTSRDNRYLHALLLDYGQGGNAAWDITRGLRDYLVQVDADNPDLLVGKAYTAVGAARLAVGFFVLERWRRGPAVLPPRRPG